jgi:RimJ/RimL family protein N-acetyltransferase
MTVTVRAMTEADLPRLVAWFREPHVFKWWRTTPDLDAVRAKYLPRIEGRELVHMLIVSELDHPFGEPTAIGRSLGTALVARLLELLRERYALGTRVSVTPHADNGPSRRILENNGFVYVETVARGDAHYRRAL